MRRKILYISAGFFSFLCFLIVLAPAAPIWRLVGSDFSRRLPDLQILTIKGTIWRGRAQIQYRRFPSSLLSWQLDPIEIIRGNAVVQLNLSGPGHEFSAELSTDTEQLAIHQLRGELHSSYINSVSRAEGLEFSGQFDAIDMNLVSDLRWIQSVSGRVRWPGGKIVSRTRDAGTRVFDLPSLQGDLAVVPDNAKKDSSIRLHIHHNSQPIVNISLKPDGWLVVEVKARLFDLAALPWPSGTSPEDIVLVFEEKII